MISISAWSNYPWLRHGFTERRGGASLVFGAISAADGALNLGFTVGDEPAQVRRNRTAVLRELVGDAPVSLVTARQVHGTHVHLVRVGDTGLETLDGRATLEADGLMTAAAGILLGIQAADCVAVLVADTRLRIVAGFHAGWRGTVAGIVEQGIARLRAEFGCLPEDLTAAIGPAIGVCCYAVGEEVQTCFRDAFSYASSLLQQEAGATHLDLAEANRRQLLAVGLHPERVLRTDLCTACAQLAGRRRFFSHRAEQGRTGRAMGLIGIFP